jgi:hypothetical protein
MGVLADKSDKGCTVQVSGNNKKQAGHQERKMA